MAPRGRRNLKRKRKRTREEPTASALSEGGDHDEDLMKRNSKKDQFPSTKPTAAAEEAQPSGAGKEEKEKRKRVVRDRLLQGLIDVMIVHSASVYEIPDEELDLFSEESRASYAKRKVRSEKMMANEQALIDQYLINGYAESVWEVTDDEDDGDGSAEKDSIN